MTSTRLSTSASSLVDASVRRVAIPVLVVLGYVAFILAGYNPFGLPFVKGNEALALPLYFYFALALLTFEIAIAQPGTWGLQIYVTLTSAFTLGFVANTVYFGASNDLAHNPTTYLVINIAALIAFIFGLVTQQMTASGRNGARRRSRSRRLLPRRDGAHRAGAAGLSVLGPAGVRRGTTGRQGPNFRPGEHRRHDAGRPRP